MTEQESPAHNVRAMAHPPSAAPSPHFEVEPCANTYLTPSTDAIEYSSTATQDVAGCYSNQLLEVSELLKQASALLADVGRSHPSQGHAGDSIRAGCTTQAQGHPTIQLAAASNHSDATSPNSVPGAFPNPVASAIISGGGSDISDGREHHRFQDLQQSPNAVQPVLASRLTGWAAVENALTNFDRQEIGGYKEDIDSLLTFTGLYSAVLTAFVIVSYPLLQEDTAGETLRVLNIIANQTTPAAPTVTTPSFQPSAAAVRINVLWFASLVISLATASFAILVKQWLRAYMAFASASPQGQLRIRYFRRGGLETWKVFGIASMLPLLLQLSLALFFAGLCVFTVGVHPSIGRMTIPLVGAWGLLFTAVTVTPIFSLHCPYKTPIAHTIRRAVYPLILVAATKYIPFGIVWLLYNALARVTLVANHPLLHAMHGKVQRSAQRLFRREPLKPMEVADIMKNTRHDLNILVSADALQADDYLLATTIKLALEQSDANWIQLIEFAVRVIGNRIPLVEGDTDLGRIYESYCSLPTIVREVVNDIFKSYVIPKAEEAGNVILPLPENWDIIARWAFCIFIHIDVRTIVPLLRLTPSLGTTEMLYWRYATLRCNLSNSATPIANADISRRDLVIFVECLDVMFKTQDLNSETIDIRNCEQLFGGIMRGLQDHRIDRLRQGLRSCLVREAARILALHLDSYQRLPMARSEGDDALDSTAFEFTDLAVELYYMSRGALDGVEAVRGYTPLQRTFQQLLLAHKGDIYSESKILRHCLILNPVAVWQILEAVYVDDIYDRRLPNILHDTVNNSVESIGLSRVDVLKLSLFHVSLVCSGEQVRLPLNSHEIKQWRCTFSSLAYKFFTSSDKHPMSDVLRASQHFAIAGWSRMPCLNDSEDSPIPDYFYLMLWEAAGCRTSWIPAYHPQLMRMARMSEEQRRNIRIDGLREVALYARKHHDHLQSSNEQGPEDGAGNDSLRGSTNNGSDDGIDGNLDIRQPEEFTESSCSPRTSLRA